MHRYYRRCLTACLTLLLVALPAMADVRLPHVIGDNMVLQRDVPVPIWGWAAPGEKVTVRLGEQSLNAVADAAGAWQVKLPALTAGGPHDLVVTGQNTITLKNILVGEVWICSGQSNMEMGINQVQDAEKEIAAANYPEIRTFQVPHRPAGQPLPDVDAEWRVCTPDNIKVGIWGGFSATAYFFGRELHRELKVPVGLICTSWGGTRIEPWTPPCGFADLPKLEPIKQEIAAADAEYRAAVSSALGPIDAWVTAARAALSAEKPLPPAPAWPRHGLAHEGRPTGLYNGMVHALVPFALRGAIWYQGESNAAGGDGMLYFEKMKALIGGWRSVWGQDDFPFYYVQIAPFRYQKIQKAIAPTAIPEVWQAQTAALAIPNTGMAVTTDITDLDDIHPKNKQEVGRRLALWALANTYGQKNLVYSGPLYKSMAVEGNKIRVSFDHVGGGLAARDDKPLTWFEIAGADQKFVKAEARIDGATVVVSSDAVAAPVAVRFGWSMEAEPNLMNKDGLPASPFRTDQW
ncbi:MAG: sialate O-acetylesterase [Phycisphaerae bacterium]|nr:sialate O-acetylesterase [Phycisphaerae bacterium]